MELRYFKIAIISMSCEVSNPIMCYCFSGKSTVRLGSLNRLVKTANTRPVVEAANTATSNSLTTLGGATKV